MTSRTPLVNEVIVFRKRKDPCFGVMKDFHGQGLTVFTEEGKELGIDLKKFVLSTGIKFDKKQTPSEYKLKLRTLRKELELNKQRVDIEMLWECISDSDAIFKFEQLINIYFGNNEADDKEILLLFWALEKDKIYFVRNDNGYKPRTKKEVSNFKNLLDLKRIKEEEKIEAIRIAREIISGSDVIDNNKVSFNFKEYIELLKGYVIYLDKDERANEAKSFMSESGIRDLEGAIEFLIKTGNWNEDDDPRFKRMGITRDFKKNIYQEAQKLYERDLEEETLEDLSELNTYTIDDESTVDIDDAISIEKHQDGYIVGIHISNVAGFVDKWSILDEEAANRGESIYLTEYNIHMFPLELISRKFSLHENSPMYAISLMVEFDQRLNIKNYRFTNSKIIVNKNLSYEEASSFFIEDSDLKSLVEIAENLRNKRLDKGAFVVHLPKLKIIINEQGQIVVQKYYMNTIAHLVVSEFMILMNWLAAKFFKENKIPAIFRSQTEPVHEEARLLDRSDPLYPLKAVKFLRPSKVGLEPEPHCLLGLDFYVQVTSPIRRYLDLILQRQILGHLRKHGYYYTEDELESLYPRVDVGVRDKKYIEKARERYWIFKYLKNNEGKEIKGVVSSSDEKKNSIYLPDYLFEVQIPKISEVNPSPGDTVILVIKEVDPLRQKICLVPKGVCENSFVQSQYL